MIKTPKGIILWYMGICGFDGFASYWGVIYIRKGHEANKQLIAHERCHLAQMRSSGKLAFTVKYLYWLIRYGYYNNPYEVEAREIAAR